LGGRGDYEQHAREAVLTQDRNGVFLKVAVAVVERQQDRPFRQRVAIHRAEDVVRADRTVIRREIRHLLGEDRRLGADQRRLEARAGPLVVLDSVVHQHAQLRRAEPTVTPFEQRDQASGFERGFASALSHRSLCLHRHTSRIGVRDPDDSTRRGRDDVVTIQRARSIHV
jgi:hypothetical protein